jgi:hypothetical protein
MDHNSQGEDEADGSTDTLFGTNRSTDQDVSTDRLFELLASPGNRFVLTYLLRVGGPVEYADLVEYVVERTEAPEDLTEAKFRGRVAATLINQRLPELESAGMVEIDRTNQLVSPGPAVDVVRPHLALALSDLIFPATTEGHELE